MEALQAEDPAQEEVFEGVAGELYPSSFGSEGWVWAG